MAIFILDLGPGVVQCGGKTPRMRIFAYAKDTGRGPCGEQECVDAVADSAAFHSATALEIS